eukprot:CAMPEP_0173244560 /NCGR_PEP_ID=MMETSP1142-20121109/16171_1 /TAXON_ID=483371 /ORGANISM="non described non described, Strain CCMP2298" /LENGTH=142 /DNA_ID=CAMNT_0014176369 /DNA_START=229 /DNA_END=653 /DNA_ORIENTATION=-
MPAWIVAFDPHTGGQLVSGGDDCVLKLWDVSGVTVSQTRHVEKGEGGVGGVGGEGGGDGEDADEDDEEVVQAPLAVNRKHEAGVTAAQWHPTLPSVFATGSYDGFVRVWGGLAQPLLEVDTGGGVWRVKWVVCGQGQEQEQG